MKILITGGNNAKTMKLLKAFPGHFILLGDYGDVPAIFTESYAFSSLGKLNKDSIAHILLNFCITESIDSIIPLHHFEVEPIAKSAVLFGEYGIDVLLPHFDQLNKYIDNEQTAAADLNVFVNGKCIFSTTEKKPEAKEFENELNGVFVTDSFN
ncbi:MAG: hypothetical protein EOP00_30825, partial [Pedobacter sp.]